MVNIPIVTLDKIYITTDEENIYFLDCTRIDKSSEIISRKKESLLEQIKRISEILVKKEIIIADDVVFSGNVLKGIIKEFEKRGIRVVGIISSICTNEAYRYFNNELKFGLKCNYKLEDNVIDQICERDFYFGIIGSGIMVRTKEGLYKAPYFKPYGNPFERASIPLEFEDFFSKGCLERSLYLWNEIEKLKQDEFLIGELPEKIIYTNENQSVVKTLKKEIKKI